MAASKKQKAVLAQSRLEEIRRLAVIAMFSDDLLMEHLVLKGGNALDIAHNLATRTSMDIDLSIEGDLDPEELKNRIFRSLSDRFDSAGYAVFDLRFGEKPSAKREGQPLHWGGYCVEFKVIEKSKLEKYRGNLENVRRNAEVVGLAQKRTFTIDLSKHEFCEGKQRVTLDEFEVFVYPLPMIALEKLRAICQQMPEYTLRTNPSPRARDFYDIHAIVTRRGVELATSENTQLLKHIFAAKGVPVALLGKISEQREFHRQDWAAVRDSVSGELRDFDFYFDFVLDLVRDLQACGVE